MKRILFPLWCLAAFGAVLAVAAPGVAQERAWPFRLTPLLQLHVEDLGGFPETPTLEFTILGEGTIGMFIQIATVHFYWVGGEPPFSGPGMYLFEESSVISVLDEDGQPTDDEIYVEASGANNPGVLGAYGGFRITGGAGIYEGASGGGSVQYAYPGTYIGSIRR